ncbi:GntR family transcriptional regulator, partial [Faecalibacterium wellingii]|uniref:GntR family transcriptional regulator n=1 Tax=Faecalibacterium wellingii TaxID=2929491 RepID=UPI0039BD12C0
MVHLTTALDPSSSVPLYEQLYHSLAGEMRSGTLSAGVRMPGKRRLAAELSVSVNTVDAAYQMLAAEGYLESRERSGFYVQEYSTPLTSPTTTPVATPSD